MPAVGVASRTAGGQPGALAVTRSTGERGSNGTVSVARPSAPAVALASTTPARSGDVTSMVAPAAGAVTRTRSSMPGAGGGSGAPHASCGSRGTWRELLLSSDSATDRPGRRSPPRD